MKSCLFCTRPELKGLFCQAEPDDIIELSDGRKLPVVEPFRANNDRILTVRGLIGNIQFKKSDGTHLNQDCRLKAIRIVTEVTP